MDTNEIHRQICNLIRSGRVTHVDYKSEKCRVRSGQLHTDFLNWLAPAAGETREWHAPSVGEQVIVLCLNGDPAQGVVLRGLPSDHVPLPSHLAEQHVRHYSDGATISYDWEKHALDATLPGGATLNVTVPGSVTIKTKAAIVEAQSISLDAKTTTCTGALLVKGPLSFESGMSGQGGSGKTMRIAGGAEFTQDIVASGKSLIDHIHQANGEHSPTSPPL